MTDTVMVVLNKLYAGEKLKLRFPNAETRELFRQSLYKVKREQDGALLALDLVERKMVLKFKPEKIEHQDADGLWCDYDATFWLAHNERKEITFEIISVEQNPEMKEQDDGANHPEVSGSVEKVS
jgi:hypothetical protein